MTPPATLVELLSQQAHRLDGDVLYRFLHTGEVTGPSTEWSYRELERRARRIAGRLLREARPGDRALLLYPPGLDFVAAFFGCLYAGVIAVPAYPPDPARMARTLARLLGITVDCGARLALTTSSIAALREPLTSSVAELGALHWIATDAIDGDESEVEARVRADDIAFLQYTSGSTSAPRGVRVTHANVLACEAHIAEAFGNTPESICIGWLPVYHDMGLIGNLLQPLFGGFPLTFMSPLDFLARPVRWLAAISHYRGTLSGGPDFAYYLCTRRVPDAELAALDLSSWQVAFNGAEPVRAETLELFTQRMSRAGFRREALLPCYGLAEATLIVTGASATAPPVIRSFERALLGGDGAVARLVSSGRPPGGQRVLVVDPETRRPCADGQVGEIWVSGPNVASGYYGASEEQDRAVFAAELAGASGPDAERRFLRTGDLGLSSEGELFVTGRAKDLLIVRGRNFYPQDIERCAEKAAPEIRPGCSAAFNDLTGAPVLVAEVGSQVTAANGNALASKIRTAVLEELELRLEDIVFIRARTIPKTSSGKIQRRSCASLYETGELLRVTPAGSESAPVDDGAARREAELLGLFRRLFAAELRIAPEAIAPDATAAQLGLDSVMMMNLQSEVERALARRLPDFSVWYDTSPAGLARQLGAPEPDSAESSLPPAATDVREPASMDLPVSFGQERLWVLDRLAPETPLYNLLFGLRVRGEFDRALLARALERLHERHPVLRSCIYSDEGVPRARLLHSAPELVTIDLQHTADPEAQLHAEAQRLGAQPFDLENGPLSHATLFVLGPSDHALCLAQHHTVSDGWSLQLLAQELLDDYSALREGRSAALQPAPSFFEHARTEREALPARHAERAYWTEQLANLPPLKLPGRTPSGVRSLAGATHAFELGPELTGALRDLGRRESATLFVVLAAAFSTLLHRYGGGDDFGLGTVVANRQAHANRELVGFLANTVVLRCRPDRKRSLREWLAEVRRLTAEAAARAALPFSEVVTATNSGGRHDLTPLFRAAIIFESFPFGARELSAAEWQPFCLAPDASVPGTAKFDVSLLAAPSRSGGLALALEYRTDLFEAPFVERMSGHLEQILRGMLADLDVPLGKVQLLRLAEAEALAAWSAGASRPYRRDARVHELVAEQARRTPLATAVVFEDEQLTYAELEARSEALAARLREVGAGPGSQVAVSVRRSLDMVVGLLGVMKSAAAYVPLDPEYPAERRRHVLDDSGAQAIVVHESTRHAFDDAGLPVVGVDRCGAAPPAVAPTPVARTDGGGGPDDSMYVIYTSGSTGKPKGVRVSHRSVVAFLDAMDERLGVPPEPAQSAWLALSSISFDISVLEIFWPLVHGMTVVVQDALHPSSARPSRDAPRAAAAMDFGLFYFAADDGKSSDGYRLLFEGARFADEHGFSSVWMPERHFHAFGGLYPNPSVTAAAVAAITRRVKLRAGSVVLPLHHPVRVAEEWAVVDNISCGRVGLSVASGWHADDFVFAPERYAARREHMQSSLDTLRRLWRGEAAQVVNGRGETISVELRPRPVQPELPVWLTAAGTADTFEAAGRLGAGILTHLLGQSSAELRDKLRVFREARQRAGHDGPGQVVLMLHTFVAHDPEFVRSQIEAPFRNYLRTSSDLLRGLAPSLNIGDGKRAFSDDELNVLVEHAFRRYVEHAGLFGTPESCRERVEGFAEIGVTEIGCLIDFGIPTATVLDNLSALDQLRRRVGSAREYSVASQVAARRITHLQCTPSLAQMLMFDDASREALERVEHLLLGGEVLPSSLARELLAGRASRDNHGPLLNMYGPTETTIWSTTHHVSAAEDELPIGRPIANTRVYVLDESLERCPVGVPGELFIGGDGVVSGYHQRDELERQRFLPDPFQPGARMYRTGDRAVWREDRTLGYLGREDHQVKLRGHRIELGEIEAVIESLPSVERAVAKVWGGATGDQRLVAYVVPSRDGGGGVIAPAAAPSGSDTGERESLLRARLAEVLPAHMLPSAYVWLSSLPTTPNGKIDRAGLPTPDENPSHAAELVPPRNDLERQLVEIWSQALGLPTVSCEASFFDLGGHSLLMARVHARLKAELGLELPLVRLFQYPTISALVRFLESAKATRSTPATLRQDGERQREALRRLAQRERRSV